MGNIDFMISVEIFFFYLEYIVGGDVEINFVVYIEDRSIVVVEFNIFVGMFIVDFILLLK